MNDLRRKIFAALLLALIGSVFFPYGEALASVKTSGGMYIVDDAEGYAPVKNGNKNAARDEAKRMAYRDALEKALGACITGVTEMENYAVTRDKIFARTQGIVKGFEITSEHVDDDGVLTIVGVCKVGERDLDGVLGPDVINFLGNPRIMILVDERIGGEKEPPFINTTVGEVQRVFEKAGYLLVDSDQAQALVNMDASTAFDDPKRLMEYARTLRADVIITGRAHADTLTSGKVEGYTVYRVGSTVQLKAVMTKTAYQLGSEVARNEDKFLSLKEGGLKGFQKIAPKAAESVVYKIAYNLAQGTLGGRTINIKISNIQYKEVQTLEAALNELAGKSGSVYSRGYENENWEVDVVSEKTADNIAAFLSENGVKIDGVTAQTVTGRIAEVAVKDASDDPAPPPGGSSGICGVSAGIGAIVSVGLLLLVKTGKVSKKRRP